MKKVVVMGQGYVGLPIALSAAKSGFHVIGFDTNREIVEKLNTGISHIADIQDSFLLSFLENGCYTATSNPAELSDAEIIVIAVPTPLDLDRKPDISFLVSASEIIGKNLQVDALVINESTSFPGTLRNIISKRINEISKKEHLYAVSPERVDPGNIVKRIKLENHGALKGKKILVCGISYKPDVSDVRESPSIELISLLKAEGADVSWHDPVVATYDNRTSFAISDSKFDVTILAIRHKGMNLDLIANSAEYVFDCLGLIPSAVQL